MGPTAALRWRRNAAQRLALAPLERQLRAADAHQRCKYLRDFSSSFRSYEAVVETNELESAYAAADVLLVGDYHALPQCQKFAAELVAALSRQRPVVLALEVVFARDQEILEEWTNSEIDDAELRERIRFDLDWGYDWAPFLSLLKTAREHQAPIFALDCMPRNDLRRIAARDRHAAVKIAEIRELYPDAAVVALFGESHLTPGHLPLHLRQRRPEDRLVTVLQNVDALYWMAAGERREQVRAVRVEADVFCVFNATPLEKYESYRLCLERWCQDRPRTPDLTPAFYNLVDGLLRFLNIDKYSASNGRQPRFLVDYLPEVYSRPTAEQVRRLLTRKGAAEVEVEEMLGSLERRGCLYLPELRSVLIREFRLSTVAETAAHFVHSVCRQAPPGSETPEPEDRFYTRVLENALADFGSRLLCPARPSFSERNLCESYEQPQEFLDECRPDSEGEFMHVLDLLLLHKDYEAHLRQYRERPLQLGELTALEDDGFTYATRQLGYILGSELYSAYLAGCIAKRFLRSLFFRRLEKPGAARTAYFATQRRIRRDK